MIYVQLIPAKDNAYPQKRREQGEDEVRHSDSWVDLVLKPLPYSDRVKYYVVHKHFEPKWLWP